MKRRRLGVCIHKALNVLKAASIAGEMVVADDGSTDGSQRIAQNLGARVVEVPERGYGNPLLGGIAAAIGRYIIMGNADESYDFGHIPRFLKGLRAGTDLVMGNRFRDVSC
jgi:glycosyltransferase involved in cell wall biosynthesis